MAEQSLPTEAPIKEILTDAKLLLRHGPKRVIPLPQDDEPLLDFIQEMASELKDSGIYRRDTVVVVPHEAGRRLRELHPKAFCSSSQHTVLTAKVKYDSDRNPYHVIRDMPTDVAEKVLISDDFWPQIPEIDAVHPAPMPAMQDGQLVFLEEGYDAKSKTMTFKLA